MKHRILVVDDERSMLDVLERHLVSTGFEVTTCLSGEAALETLKRDDFSVVITDLKMAGLNGIELCDRIAGNQPDLPVLILTAFGTLDTAVEAIRAGAFDFVVKPVSLDALSTVVDRAIRTIVSKRQIRKLERGTAETDLAAEEMQGESPFMVELRSTMKQVAHLNTSILLTGESGTGKELAAKTLHRESGRSDFPFIVVNCATIPEASFELELFGRVDPATGETVPGLVGSAAGGTLFFDEIVQLPLTLQPKLLRLLEERCYRPAGGRDELECTARFVVASNEDLEHAVRKGGFREDLFFRINVMHIKLVPLRERGNDVLILAHHFMKHFSARFDKDIKSISDPVAERLAQYQWPGNVRELRNSIERAVAVTKYDHLVVEDLPEAIRRFKVSDIFKDEHKDRLIPVDTVEQRHILGVLKELKGNKALAAKVLGMDRKTLYRKLERYGYDE